MVDNYQVFRGWDDADRDRRIFCGDDAFAANVVADRIDYDAQCSKAGADFGTAVDIVFAYAASENEHVQAVQFSYETADPFGNCPGELVHG